MRLVHGSKWPISNSLLMLYAPNPQGMMLLAAALEYSGWKLNGVPGQVGSVGLVFMKPFAADAIMNPDVRLVTSSSVTSSARPPPFSLASKMWMTIVSPGLISSVSPFGVNVARSDS